MQLFVEVRRNHYLDSIVILTATAMLNSDPDVARANIAMGTQANKAVFDHLGLTSPAFDTAEENDLVIAMLVRSEERLQDLLRIVDDLSNRSSDNSRQENAYRSIEQAVLDNPDANVCVISVPGEYARVEAEKALNAGLHVILFSNAVSGADELAIKELAQSKGLLCMGPDCGVVNLNGVAFILASINNRGPFGICGASGCGIQHVAALLHANGTGISQGIGTGGMDLKKPVGGITMLMGIDALESDPDTKFIILISRKPEDETLNRILNRVKLCKKPVVVYFMGADRQQVEDAGGIWAENLDDTAVKALTLVGKNLVLMDDAEIDRLAEQAVTGMQDRQKYVRGMFVGGTYCDEAMRVLSKKLGGIYSNVPFAPELQLEDSTVCLKNACVDYGEEEFTLGRPHPTIFPEIRSDFIMKEAADSEVAVLLFDFILSPSAHMDPVGTHVPNLEKAIAMVAANGGRLAVVASICGTDADLQGLESQKVKLREAGVFVCPTNHTAAKLAARIAEFRNGGSK